MPEYLEHPLIKEKALQAREYQQSILETALKKNVLCVLPTGLGKTNVAVLLAAHRLGELPESRILVLAPTRPLVNQHYESFSRFLKIGQEELQVVTGAVKPAERKALYQEKRIIFATPQCVTGDTTIFTPNQGIVKIKNFVENHKLKKCNYGSKIGFCGNSDKFTIGLENGVISSVEVKKVWKLPANILYKIDTELKNSITCTPEHPLLTIEPDGPIKWKEARHIKEGVWIAMPRKIALPEQELDLYKLLEKEKTN
ncbi:MAG: DEAD/DEAH box helicase, partial [Candidatus Aenigmatarchaeota archaeon]